MSLILTILAFYIAANMIMGNGPIWPAITAYWIVVTVKNALDVWEGYQDDDL